jgi:hypothetical protein
MAHHQVFLEYYRRVSAFQVHEDEVKGEPVKSRLLTLFDTDLYAGWKKYCEQKNLVPREYFDPYPEDSDHAGLLLRKMFLGAVALRVTIWALEHESSWVPFSISRPSYRDVLSFIHVLAPSHYSLECTGGVDHLHVKLVAS